MPSTHSTLVDGRHLRLGAWATGRRFSGSVDRIEQSPIGQWITDAPAGLMVSQAHGLLSVMRPALTWREITVAGIPALHRRLGPPAPWRRSRARHDRQHGARANGLLLRRRGRPPGGDTPDRRIVDHGNDTTGLERQGAGRSRGSEPIDDWTIGRLDNGWIPRSEPAQMRRSTTGNWLPVEKRTGRDSQSPMEQVRTGPQLSRTTARGSAISQAISRQF